MTFRNQLKTLGACPDALKWIKNKTIEEAWETCENFNWMLWILNQTDMKYYLIDPICDIAEKVLYLVPEDKLLVCINAISAARRRANKKELKDAYDAARSCAIDACYDTRYAASAAAYSAAYAAAYAADIVDYDVSVSSYNTASDAASFAADAEAAVTRAVSRAVTRVADSRYVDAAAADAYRKEQKNQCDILRKYFTIDQVKEAFNKLVA